MHRLEKVIADFFRRFSQKDNSGKQPEKILVEGSEASEAAPLILALSGGPDSVALLLAIHAIGCQVHAAHCNFHLRGAESDRDENFCKALCERLAVPLHVIHFDTREYASLHKVSIEMAARDLRYHYFVQLCNDIHARAVCIAHHRDDQVETVLLNIIRGTGLRGLIGMRPETTLSWGSKSCTILRPMLGVSEDDIMAYLKDKGQDYVVDSSNLEDDVQRNKLRLDIIPMLEKVNPGFKKNLIRMTENMAEVEKSLPHTIVLQNAVRTNPAAMEEDGAYVLASYDMGEIKACPSPLMTLHELLAPLGFNRTQEMEMTDSKEDNRQWASADYVAVVSRGKLYIVSRETWERPMPLLRIPEPGLYRYGGARLRVTEETAGEGFAVPKERHRVAIDSGRVRFPLTLRPARDGDRLTPFGMRGSKLVGDYLKDRHRNAIDRHRQLVLTDATGNILWLVGETIDNHYRVDSGKTSACLVISFTV